MTENGFTVQKMTLIQRMWRKLGFKHRHLERPGDVEGFAPGYVGTMVVSRLDWRDRVRVLVSGHVVVETFTKTDVEIASAVSTSMVSVLPPGKVAA